ncbi:MAG: ImmA/IrrE family metallo-endopeptidase [Pirellulales bacterium]|nr:ImmA/IrrE family metallo-endopeptidase [Pirellulales bacterium]
MTSFRAGYLEIEPRELVRYLLRNAGQFDREYINPQELLEFLKLDYTSFHFATELPEEARCTLAGASPRALLSFADRLIATDDSLSVKRERFSVLHEIGHYVLPHHEHALYVCDDIGLSFGTRLMLEKEANDFAADLLFLGDRFSAEANSRQISTSTVKELATRYQSSFEATARRLVEKNFRPCMLIVFKQKNRQHNIDVDATPSWDVRYCAASPIFKTRFFEKLRGEVPPEAVAAVTQSGKGIEDSYVCEISVSDSATDKQTIFQAEFFFNTYNIFCLLTPKT